jgi:hypothetical protein
MVAMVMAMMVSAVNPAASSLLASNLLSSIQHVRVQNNQGHRKETSDNEEETSGN